MLMFAIWKDHGLNDKPHEDHGLLTNKSTRPTSKGSHQGFVVVDILLTTTAPREEKLILMEMLSVKDLSSQKRVPRVKVRLIQHWENGSQPKDIYEIGILFLGDQV